MLAHIVNFLHPVSGLNKLVNIYYVYNHSINKSTHIYIATKYIHKNYMVIKNLLKYIYLQVGRI